MAIDYVIDYLCEPKKQLTTGGILARLKGRDQAERIIQLYRDAGDTRPYDQMGFELTRNSPQGEEETQIILVSDLMNASAELDPHAHHCVGCPAHLSGKAFGCFGRIPYPISDHAERWLLLQLPKPDEALMVWSLIAEYLRELNQQSHVVEPIRAAGTYFESELNPRRRLGEIAVSGNNVFHLLFLQGHVIPSRAALLLLFFGAIPRNLEAPDILKLTPAPADVHERYPFQHQPDPSIDDASITALKAFFRALYTAWQLNVNLQLDV